MSSNSDKSFPVGSRIILHGLQKGAQYNGRIGIVKSCLSSESSSSAGRQTVYIPDESKSLNIKPFNLKYEPRPIDSLSVREMKTILLASRCEKDGKLDDEISGMDKSQLRSYIVEQVGSSSGETMAKFLAEAYAADEAPPAPSAKNNQNSNISQQMENVNPAQLRQQAAMMKTMTADQIRGLNPQMAGMSDSQIAMSISQMEMMASNPEMMKTAMDQMKGMSSEDVARAQQLAAGGGAGAAFPSPDNAAQQMANMTPDQMRQQAAMMKSMDPATIRSMNPQMSQMTDEQIKMAAQQMEMMASNPEMMQQVTDQLKGMSPEDVKELQNLQKELGAGGDGASDPASMIANMDAGKLKKTMEILKRNPAMLRSMMASSSPAMSQQAENLSDEQLQKTIETFSNMDEKQIKAALGFMSGMSKISKPFINGYSALNGMLFGKLNKIILFLCVIGFVMLLQRFGIISSDVSSKVGKSTVETLLNSEGDTTGYDTSQNVEDEFSEF